MEINRWGLKAARDEAEYNQKQMAEKLGMHISTYQRKENNPGKFFLKEVVKICEVLDKSIQEIFF